VVLDLPTPQTLTSPPEGAQGVDLGTPFQWSDGSSAAIFSVTCAAAGVRINVVTAGSEAQLPTVPGLGMAVPSGADCLWHIEVHGAYVSVDDASGPAGMVDPCLYDDDCERASLRGDGSVTVSDWRAFQTAP
jgi:hypothetical protein